MLDILWEASVTAAYASAILIVLRLILRKRAPRQVLCLLWLVVFARLLIPVSLESPLSIVPEARPAQGQLYLPQQDAGQQPANPVAPTAPVQNPGQAANPVISNPNPPALTLPGDEAPAVPPPEAPAPFPWRAVITGVWLAGGAAMGSYGLISYLRLRRRLFGAIRARDGAWEHPAVDSPFILGMLRPRIYLPAGLAGQARSFILCHERAHLRRLDHIVKPVCWTALALHWFNPLVWAAYVLMSRDIEAACDEAVVRQLGPQVKADYSYTLLALATGRRLPAPSPLAFDEGDAKGRIKHVLGYRRPALWVIVVSSIAAVLAAVCLLTDPVSARNESEPIPDPTPTATQGPEAGLSALLDPWMKEVLDGERQFISAYSHYAEGDGRTYSIHDLRTFYYGDDQFPDAVVEAGRLAVIDLDRDGVNEMVIWPEGEYEYLYSVVGYLILHRQGDEIYGYNPVYRAFGNLKSDGTFDWSGSAFNWGIGSALFTENSFEVKNITWCEIHSETDERYFVDGAKATREEFEAATGWGPQNRKPEAAWFTYEDGRLAPYLPAGAALLAEASPDTEAGAARLWQGGGGLPWLEWNGAAYLLGSTVTADQFPALFVRDFDGDGQNELALQWMNAGFARYEVYEWNNGALTYADAFDTQDDLLLRFNQNNVAAYSKDGRMMAVTYSHNEGDPDSEDFDRRYITGSCVLPEDFFNGYEHIRDGRAYVYACDFRRISFNPDNSIRFELLFCPADETMKDLVRVVPPYEPADEHCMMGHTVGTAAFTLSYDGANWVLQAPDQLDMGVKEEPTPIDITTAAPLSAPVTDLMGGLPNDPEEWYKVAELPDDMIWVYSRNEGEETLIRWDGNFYKVFGHRVHDRTRNAPKLKKLGGGGVYGPLAVIRNLHWGAGSDIEELVIYDLDSSDVPSYVHDWSLLRDEFNGDRTFQYDRNTRTITCAYEGQTAELIIDDSREETFRRIEEDGVSVRVTGELVFYQFDEDGTIQIEFPLEVFIGNDVVSAPLVWPWFLRWTTRFDSERAAFETVPGSCELFTYAGQ